MKNVEFVETDAYVKIHTFILAVDDSIKNSEQRSNERCICILENIEKIIEETEKSTENRRYANVSACTVLKRIAEEYEDEYLKNSFGNLLRLDYGTGHELNYLCYLYTQYCMEMLQLCEVFFTLVKYFEVVRIFVKKFSLEPAGSHGAWGLDDYQFLPFLFGSSELFHSQLKVGELEKEKCYVVAVKEKLGGTSQLLEGITDRSWPCVNRGLIKMYDDHVLRRSVVTQHFIYGKYLSSEKPSRDID